MDKTRGSPEQGVSGKRKVLGTSANPRGFQAVEKAGDGRSLGDGVAVFCFRWGLASMTSFTRGLCQLNQHQGAAECASLAALGVRGTLPTPAAEFRAVQNFGACVCVSGGHFPQQHASQGPSVPTNQVLRKVCTSLEEFKTNHHTPQLTAEGSHLTG